MDGTIAHLYFVISDYWKFVSTEESGNSAAIHRDI